MKFKIVLIIILAAAVGTFAFEQNTTPPPSSHPSHKAVWYCPMHPHYTSDKPGTCPICGMDLVKQEAGPEIKPQPTQADNVPGYAAVSISAPKQQLMGLRVATVGKKTVIKTIRAPGIVAYDPDLYKAETQYVEDYIAYGRLDRRVNKGSYTVQDAARKLKEEELDLLHMGATEEVIGQLKKNKFPDHSLLVTHGQGAQIFAEITESDLGFIDAGQKASVEVPAYQETYEGTVTSIDPIIDPDSRTTRVRIHVDANGELHSNMFVHVSMRVPLEEAIVVPRDAVMDTGLRKVVFVQRDNGGFEPREVYTGWETDDGYEVKSGLKEGEHIVVSGNFLLDSESRLQAGLQEDSNGQ